ncbi:uncharacterized protein LOC123535483 [Mercenaria mercenaria]|uniref:uncharacterized protein LOC123535483 n=1 Tax=Mercenaria mercenaria TaxID=6596 RepID=UPI001E1DCEF8|nr:uncharacterized protein LOC123535483 [Mercenaria mercenaria]
MRFSTFIFGLFVIVSLKCLQTDAHFDQCPVRKVITYNAALLDHPLSSGLPNNRLLRREAIINELRRLDADVVCLQEVWIGQDVERIVTELSDQYTFSHSKLHVPGKLSGNLPCQDGPSMPPCNYHAINQFTNCVRKNKCLRRRLSQAQTYTCINFNCYHLYETLSQDCVGCMTASWQDISTVFQKCVGTGLPAINMRTVNAPGLLLLSKRPLHNAKYTDFHPFTKEFIERGYIEADTQDLGKVVCTHTTHSFPFYSEMELSRKGHFSSYLEQGRSERNELIKQFGNSYPMVLAGDFNIGDTFGPLINQDLPQEFCHLAKYFDVTPVKQCTICWPHENIYTKSSQGVLHTVVDHIFHRGHQVVKSLRVVTPDDATLDNLPLSNHNGVMTVLSLC